MDVFKTIETPVFPPPTPHQTQQTVWAELYASQTPSKPQPLTTGETTGEENKVFSNAAADVAKVGASLLVGDGIKASFNDGVQERTANRANLYFTECGLNARWNEAHEIAAVFGGAFLRLVVDKGLRPYPYITIKDPLHTLPVFVDGVLVAATFWTELQTVTGGPVYRWVEHRDNRTRKISNRLYKGDRGFIGKPVPLTTLPETEYLAEETPYPAGVEKMVFYLPNDYPNPSNVNSPYGRSDLQGSETLITALDGVLSSLYRDVRLSAMKILVPREVLETTDSGVFFQQNREVFTPLEIPADAGETFIQKIQGEIRADSHIATATDLLQRIVSNAGYSPATFGIGEFGSGESGTALKIRMARTISTVETKRRYSTPVLQEVVYNLLAADKIFFDVSLTPAIPAIVWPEVVSDDPLERAQTVETLVRAKALDVAGAVAQANPDIPADQVQETVTRILTENGLVLEPLPDETTGF